MPAEWWDDRSLVLERYVQNTRNAWYRAFVNFSALTVCEFADTSLVKKVGSSRFLRSWHLNLATDDPFRPEDGGLPGSAAEQLPLFLRAIGLDFGAVDLMTDDDGSAYIIDVNTTPAYNYPVPGLVSDLVTPFG